MAEVGFTVLPYDKKGWGSGQAFLVTWEGVTEADTCKRFIAPALNGGCISVDGTLGATSVALEGSNNSTDANFIPLKDDEDVVIALTVTNTLAQIKQHPAQYKPKLTGGSGTDINIRLLLYGSS